MNKKVYKTPLEEIISIKKDCQTMQLRGSHRNDIISKSRNKDQSKECIIETLPHEIKFLSPTKENIFENNFLVKHEEEMQKGFNKQYCILIL